MSKAGQIAFTFTIVALGAWTTLGFPAVLFMWLVMNNGEGLLAHPAFQDWVEVEAVLLAVTAIAGAVARPWRTRG